MLKLYGFSKVNADARGHTRDLRVLWALEEMQLPFEIVGLDHSAHELNTAAYRKLSPFEQIPSIADDEVVMSESAAIVLYLAKKAGQLIPSDPIGEAQVMRWCFAAMNTIEVPLLALIVHDWNAHGEDSQPRQFLVDWVNRMLGNLDRWLQGRAFVATDAFTVADILLAHVLPSDNKYASLLTPYANVVDYRDRCLARPAWKRAIKAYCERVKAA